MRCETRSLLEYTYTVMHSWTNGYEVALVRDSSNEDNKQHRYIKTVLLEPKSIRVLEYVCATQQEQWIVKGHRNRGHWNRND